MSRKSFKVWIRRLKDEDTPVGDLARDISCDPNFPDGDSHTRISKYLEEKSHHPGVMDAFEQAWKIYSAS